MNTEIRWGDLIVSALRKMFLNKEAISYDDLIDLEENRNYATYINQMPDIMNECLSLINTRVVCDIDTISIDLEDPELAEYIDDTTTDITFDIQQYLNTIKEDNRYLWTEVIQDKIERCDNLLFEEYDGLIYIDKRFIKHTTLRIKYRKKMQYYTTQTAYDTVVDLPYSLTTFVPLFLASEAYKDDDIAIATQYRNQFETELNYISEKQINSLGTEHSRNVLW